jgi:hypothetical protein
MAIMHGLSRPSADVSDSD